MKLVEFPKGKTEQQSAREFLTQITELVDSGEYKPCAFVVLMIEDHAMVPFACNLNKHEVVSYLAFTQFNMLDSMRTP